MIEDRLVGCPRYKQYEDSGWDARTSCWASRERRFELSGISDECLLPAGDNGLGLCDRCYDEIVGGGHGRQKLAEVGVQHGGVEARVRAGA